MVSLGPKLLVTSPRRTGGSFLRRLGVSLPENGSALGRRRVEGELDHEGGAAAGLRLHEDAAAVPLDDAVREGEPEAGPDAHGLGGEEGVEDAALDLLRDARS